MRLKMDRLNCNETVLRLYCACLVLASVALYAAEFSSFEFGHVVRLKEKAAYSKYAKSKQELDNDGMARRLLHLTSKTYEDGSRVSPICI
jgi:hypothetical protein